MHMMTCQVLVLGQNTRGVTSTTIFCFLSFVLKILIIPPLNPFRPIPPLNGLVLWDVYTYWGLRCPVGWPLLETSVPCLSIGSGWCWAGVKLGLLSFGSLGPAIPQALSNCHGHAWALPNLPSRGCAWVYPMGIAPERPWEVDRGICRSGTLPKDLAYP